MKKLENISLGNIYDVLSILRTDAARLEYKHREEMVDAMKKAEKRKLITVHLYPVWHSRNAKSLIERADWSYHQIYLCIQDGKILYSLGHGRSSGMRENHNFFINEFLKNSKLREKTPTAVIVTFKKDALAYFFYKRYAYCRHDIGTNWTWNSREKAKLQKMSCSYISYDGNFGEGKRILFSSKNEETEVYNALTSDFIAQKLCKKL